MKKRIEIDHTENWIDVGNFYYLKVYSKKGDKEPEFEDSEDSYIDELEMAIPLKLVRNYLSKNPKTEVMLAGRMSSYLKTPGLKTLIKAHNKSIPERKELQGLADKIEKEHFSKTKMPNY